MKTTEDILAEIEGRASKATAGPWDTLCSDHSGYIKATGPIHKSPSHHSGINETQKAFNDADFIAHARTDVPRMAKAIRRVMAEIKRSTDKRFHEHCFAKIDSVLRGDDEN